MNTTQTMSVLFDRRQEHQKEGNLLANVPWILHGLLVCSFDPAGWWLTVVHFFCSFWLFFSQII